MMSGRGLSPISSQLMAPLLSQEAGDSDQSAAAGRGSLHAVAESRGHAERRPGEDEAAATRRAEETAASLRHLDMSFMTGFTRFIFNPSNPFLAGGSVLASVVGVQTAWLQATYEPLPHPRDARSVGFVPFDGQRKAQSGGDTAKRLIVIGDSLVLGIGCDEAPVIANSLARGLSGHSHRDVAWRSFGVDGGDARSIQASVMADLQRVVEGRTLGSDPEERKFAGTGGGPVNVDVCVILLGLNDFKRLWKGRTAGVFGKDIKEFCRRLTFLFGPGCSLVLPFLPMEPTRFPEPLRTFVIYVSEAFDAQKLKLAGEEQHIHVIPKPSVGWWRRVHEQHGNVISVDGVHPNENGYQVYGEWLGTVVARKFFPP